MRRGAGIAGLSALVWCIFSLSTGFCQQTPAVRSAVPEQELFLMLFRSVAQPVLQQDSQVPMRASAGILMKYQSSAKLTDEQIRIVIDAAVACVKQVTEIDQKAREISLGAREQAKMSGGRPVPPPELADLQKQRNSIVEQDVNRLRGALGDAAYERLAYALSHQNVNQRGEDRASFSVSLPPELALPAPSEARIRRLDFKVPQESLYESRLPVKLMITPVGPDGAAEQLQYGAGEDVYFKVTLLNTVRERQMLHVADVLRNYQVGGTKNGQRIPSLLLWVTLTLVPSLANSPAIDIPFDVPLVIGTLRLEKRAQLDLSEGKYTFILQRSFALRPTIGKEEEALYEEIGHFALKSNTISITIHP
jgi:hypothetical protein